ncbi:hypothetical protein EVAR_61690_1 [Eumeta japonica]|uniref:Uncharacterized protein n=1 Tax=Eumeta variegata TaxID=151549 RepID=A0A4C1ZKJ3_EUMVA|nr:hypothetical protein EVAR_61690_1 [Eumeta japonica]
MSEYGIDIALIFKKLFEANRPRACAIAGYVQLRTDRTSPAGIRNGSSTAEAIPTIKITDWKKVSTAFEKSTPPLNSIPDDIRTTEQIDHAIVLLPATSGQWSRDASGRFRHPRIVESAQKRRGIPIPPLKRPDGSIVLDDAEVECIATLSRLNALTPPPHDTAHISRIEEEVLQNLLEPKDDLTPSHSARSPTAGEIAQDQKGTALMEHERTYSTRRLIRAGVPQGSALSPPLYSQTAPGRRNGNRPVTVPGDILCQDIPSGVVHKMSRAVGTHMCRPAAFGEAIEVVRPVARLVA